MRISDWSSDVCSSDLPDFPYNGVSIADLLSHRSGLPNYMYAFDDSLGRVDTPPDNARIMPWFEIADPVVKRYSGPHRRFRSEEHTTQLQSLMRISYAVFCLQKKKHNITIITKQTIT